MSSKLTVLGVVTALLLSGTLAFAAVPSMAVANDGDGDGAHEISECTVIDEPGRYTVMEDITNEGAQVCIDIRADDVTLDGTGHTIDGVDENGIGINVNGANVTVTDVTVTGFENGVANFGDLQLANSTLTENTVGLRMDMASASVVDNTISENSEAGVDVGTSDEGYDVVFDGNEIEYNGGAGIRSSVSTFTMTGNRINANGDGGVVGDDTYVESTSNYIHDNDGPGIATGLGGVNSTEDLIRDNTGDGISVAGTAVVEDSIIDYNGGNGIHVKNSGLNTGGISVSDTEITVNGGDGVYVEAGTPTELTVSEIHGSVIGDNDGFGVNNEETVVINATGNIWDATEYPNESDIEGASSPADVESPLEDPISGALADGTGDEVSEHPEKPGVSNVHFSTESPDDEDGDGEDGEDDRSDDGEQDGDEEQDNDEEQNDGDDEEQNDGDDEQTDEEEENGAAEPDDEVAYQVDLATGEVIETLGDDENDFYGKQGRLLQAKSLTGDGELTRSHGVPQGMATADGLSYGAVSYDAETGETTVEVSLADDAESDTTVTLAAYELPGDTTEFQRDRADGQELVAHQTVTLSPGEQVTITIDVDG